MEQNDRVPENSTAIARLAVSPTVASTAGFAIAIVSVLLLSFRSLDRTLSTYSSVVLVIFGVAGILMLLWFFPKTQVNKIPFEKPEQRFAAEADSRKTLAQAIGGVAFLATFYVSWSSFTVEREKTTTEEFTKGVEQLFSQQQYSRIGGAISLEKLAKSSPEDSDHIYQVLSQSLRDSHQDDLESKANLHPRYLLVADSSTNTILAVLGRRFAGQTPQTERINLVGADLRAVKADAFHLEWTDFDQADIRGGSFFGTKLNNAEMLNVSAQALEVPDPSLKAPPAIDATDCQDADLFKYALHHTLFNSVDLSDAILSGSNLQHAAFTGSSLRGSHLQGTNFRWATFNKTDFTGALLTGADMRGAFLKTAKGITQKQWLSIGYKDACTTPPDSFAVE